MAQFSANVVRVIESNEKIMIEMNRAQMMNSKGSQDNPLIHRSTKSEYLTKPYAKRTGKSKPNLFVSGDFQNGMQMFVPSEKEYFISSKDYKSGYLEKNYGYDKSIFGVPVSKQPAAKAKNDADIINDYKKFVFG